MYELGRDLATRGLPKRRVVGPKGGTFAEYVKEFRPKLIRFNEPYRPESKDGGWRVAVIAPGVETPGAILDSVILCRGTLVSGATTQRSVIFANGDVISKNEIRHCVIVSDGDVTASGMSHCALIIARGNIKLEFATDTTLIAGGKVIFKTPIPPELDLGLVNKENISNPLNFVTFFELSTVGVEAKAADKAVQITAVANGKSFASAGVRVGDIVAEVNGQKPDSPEALRRLLRDALAVGDATLKLQRGDKTETVKVSLPE
jgi:hypothetical protein